MLPRKQGTAPAGPWAELVQVGVHNLKAKPWWFHSL